jgi:hypothetical protein
MPSRLGKIDRWQGKHWDKSRWGRRRESNATSANYDLAALPLSYTGPRCRTLCDGLASYNQNLSHASEFPEHLPRRRVVQPARTSCPSSGSTKLSKVGEDVTKSIQGHHLLAASEELGIFHGRLDPLAGTADLPVTIRGGGGARGSTWPLSRSEEFAAITPPVT